MMRARERSQVWEAARCWLEILRLSFEGEQSPDFSNFPSSAYFGGVAEWLKAIG